MRPSLPKPLPSNLHITIWRHSYSSGKVTVVPCWPVRLLPVHGCPFNKLNIKLGHYYCYCHHDLLLRKMATWANYVTSSYKWRQYESVSSPRGNMVPTEKITRQAQLTIWEECARPASDGELCLQSHIAGVISGLNILDMSCRPKF
jgi:hypothetical protein